MLRDVNNVMNISQHDDVLNIISMMCTKHNAEYICIAGNMNTDFSRAEFFHTKSLLQFIRNEDLYLPWYHEKGAIVYTYSNTCTNSFSTIDHIFVSRNLTSIIMQYYSLNNEVENQSDHNPVVLALQIDTLKQLPQEIINKRRKKWKEANDNHITMYKKNLHEYLMYLTLPTNCMHCNYISCNDAFTLFIYYAYYVVLIILCTK